MVLGCLGIKCTYCMLQDCARRRTGQTAIDEDKSRVGVRPSQFDLLRVNYLWIFAPRSSRPSTSFELKKLASPTF